MQVKVVNGAAGFAIAHQVSKTPEGQKFFADVDKKAKEFSDSVVQEDRPEIRGMVATVPHLVTVEEIS